MTTDGAPPPRTWIFGLERLASLPTVELILYKTYADLRAEAAKTYINYLWWVIDPLMAMAIFYLVFGVLLQREQDGFVAFLLIGLILWNWYRQSIVHAGGALIAAKAVMGQVHVPKHVFPTSVLLTDLTKFAVVFALLLAFLWLSGYPITPAYLALPAVLLTEMLLLTALGFFLAALSPYAPDLRFVADNLLMLQFFASGIFFSPGDIPAHLLSLFYLNPMAGLIADARSILMEGDWPNWSRLLMTALASGLALAAAIALIRRWDQDYPRLGP